MIEFVNEIVEGKWFKDPSPLKINFQPGNDKLFVVTGENASGKSVLRKVFHKKCSQEKLLFVNTSVEDRMGASGLKKIAMYGSEEDDSTGFNSVKTIKKSLKFTTEQEYVLFFDEPEIGCSEELQSAIGELLRSSVADMKSLAMIIVTHSRQLIKQLLPLNPSHIRLGLNNTTLEDYSKREIVPSSIENLLEQNWSNYQQLRKMK